jgi:CheY-like chemotaxis protein
MPSCLIVEDHGDTLEGYAEYLAISGFDVFTASDARGFREILNRVIPDVVVMDIQLPEVDGWDLTAELKRDRRTRDVPVIIVSARVLPADRERSREAGCDAFLPKPCDPNDLRQAINRLISTEHRGASTADA